MSPKTDDTVGTFLLKPLFLIIVLVGLFSLVWLRSGIVSMNYEIRSLEEQKMQALKEMKMLLASKADHMSVGKISAAFKENVGGNAVLARNDSYFQNRVKVIHVKRNKEVVPYRTSLQGGKDTER